ncbi:MAG TPA: purine-nucleoside phosphorylase [Candidatus Merdivicinus intestinigallinarum]|nr:purine-nucleoside phosphorylase [Candidatus Merdivicinus intestinigallinarum]
MNTPTPHIGAKAGEIAPVVLMPGDPLRAKWIAENYLENPVCYTEVRGMLGFTGTYKGKPVSVQGSGMGCPSMGIYSHELYAFYGVETIIRVGSAGALQDFLDIGDLVIAQGACTDSHFPEQFGLPGTFAPIGDFELMRRGADAASKKGLRYVVGNVLSSDCFYVDDPENLPKWRNMGVLAVEMECAALYANAARLGKKALGILTISDCPFKGTATTAEQRQNGMKDMIETALELV